MSGKIIVIGDVMLDAYHFCSNRDNPESSAPCYTIEKTEYQPGGAGNVAKNLAKLGSRCKIISITGDDLESRIVENLLKECAIDTFLIKDKERQTSLKRRFLSSSDRRYHFRADFETKRKISSNHTDLILEHLSKKSNPLIVISDYNKGTISNRLIAELARRKLEIIADIKPIHKDFFRGGKAKFIKPNSKEAREMTGISNEINAAKKLKEELNSNIILTRGKDGIIYFGINEETYEEKPKLASDRVIDVTGAGDSVIAAFSHFYIKGIKIEECIKLANIAGEISVQHPGCYCPTEQEITDYLHKFSKSQL